MAYFKQNSGGKEENHEKHKNSQSACRYSKPGPTEYEALGRDV
jgi:hypothetical protein